MRVLAIDQAPKEKEGQNAVLGKTATLELAPDDVEVLAKARLSGTLSLALRSIADSKTTTVAANYRQQTDHGLSRNIGSRSAQLYAVLRPSLTPRSGIFPTARRSWTALSVQAAPSEKRAPTLWLTSA